jgi:hypothetical protein
MRRYWNKLREFAHDLWGRECLRCGFSAEPRALTFDHVANDGATHRRESKQAERILLWIRNNPIAALQRLQVLCANCDQTKMVVSRAA